VVVTAAGSLKATIDMATDNRFFANHGLH
jgi:hypothetical protein